MKKTLVAIAALTLVGAASAQVTITGGVRAAFYNSGVAGAKTILSANDVATNNITIQAKEDLGGGMTASARYVMRNDIMTGEPSPGGGNGVSNTTQLWRNSDASIGGNFGTVRAGRFGLDGLYAYDAFNATGAVGPYSDAIGGRYNAMIEYKTPTLAGFSATIGATSEGAANEEASWVYVNYAAGPLSARVLTEKNQAATAAQKSSVAAGVAYDFGMAKVLAGTSTQKGVVSGATISEQYHIGAQVPFGAALGKVGYMRNNTADTSIFAVGVDYALSKTTGLFLDIGKASQLANATWQAGFQKGF